MLTRSADRKRQDYSAISQINTPDRNIMTVEDPVEYNLRGINQVQVNEQVGASFASILRSFLRQDPDVVLVGEIRDLNAAEIAIKASLTGHLVLSTLHTNDAASAVARLLDMGIPSFLVATSVRLICAQRLVGVSVSSAGKKFILRCKRWSTWVTVPRQPKACACFRLSVAEHVTRWATKGASGCTR